MRRLAWVAAVLVLIAGCSSPSPATAPTGSGSASDAALSSTQVASNIDTPSSAAVTSPSADAGTSADPLSTLAGDPGQPADTASPPVAAADTNNLPVLIIHPYDGTPEYGVIRPTSVASSGDGNNIIDNMVWTSWTATEAHADAIREVQSCNPSCADGTVTQVPMTFDLSNPVDGHFTKVVETINGQVTSLTDEGFPPGNVGFVGALLGPDSLKLPAATAPAAPAPLPPTNGLPVLIIYPDGGVPYAVIRPDGISGANGGLKLSNIVWDHWTATEAMGTGTFEAHIGSSDGPVQNVEATITLTNPVRGAFSSFAFAATNPHTTITPATGQDLHYKVATPDSAKVQLPCGC